MTAEQAINELKFDRGLYESEIVSAGDGSPDGDLMLALDMGIAALEKQIPKVAEHEDGVWSICPCCGGSVRNDTEHAVNKEVSYCEHCGRALEWG